MAHDQNGPDDKTNALLQEARFLLDRLEEMDTASMGDDACRDFYGHVQPSMARLRSLCAQMET